MTLTQSTGGPLNRTQTFAEIMAKFLIISTIICTSYLVSAADDNFVRFYHGTTTDDYTDYDISSGEEAMKNSAWDSSKPVAMYLHGINESVDSESATTIAAALMKRGGWNVIAINYATQAKYSGNIVDAFAYLVTQSGIVGETVGELLNRFSNAGVSASSFYLIGYSAGAHVAGHAARTTVGTIPRITALDPHIHGWFLFGNDDHLWSTDATVVDVIHTNGILMSVATAIGTVDFFPNSGYPLQPGCSYSLTSDVFYCSSDVSWKYYAESVNNPESFESISCESWTEFETGECTGVKDYMGYGYSQKANGTFYLQTNSESPYSKGSNGVIYDKSTANALSSGIIENLVASFRFFF